MTNTFFTSDNHFGHKAIKRFCPDTRHGSDWKEMNELMIQVWNKTVKPNDTVYTLGDFSFMSTQDTVKILQRLNGRIHLILGNHDHWVNTESKTYFESVGHYKKLTIDRHKVILFHYPIYEWEHMHHGGFHLYGHVHGSTQVPGRAIDVGIDARPQKDMGLWEWEDLKKELLKREVRSHHNKTKVD